MPKSNNIPANDEVWLYYFEWTLCCRKGNNPVY